MSDTNYSVDILINDKPVRKYPFNSKLFIEARHGEEYCIRIKNNTWERVLAVTSVDGLDCLTGKKANENGNGYVINGYNSLKLDGFRVSSDEVAKFVFSTKEDSYAASKGDDSERNVGVIGVRLFAEKVKPKPVIKEIHHHHNYPRPRPYPFPWDNTPQTPKYPYDPPIIWYGDTTGETLSGTTNSPTGLGGSLRGCSTNNTEMYSCNDISLRGDIKGRCSTGGLSSETLGKKISNKSFNEVTRGFDMGTKWGGSKESKVIEIEFEKGILTLSANIYYASRQSLIEMGVPMSNEKQVSFPDPFENGKYAKPPSGWRG
jgi:hypothetical protein